MRISVLQLPLSERRPGRRKRRAAVGADEAMRGRSGVRWTLRRRRLDGSHTAAAVRFKLRLCPISGQKETLSPVGLRVSGKAPGDDLLSHGLSHTTIGAAAFHFRVRDGIGWFHSANFTRETVGASPSKKRIKAPSLA